MARITGGAKLEAALAELASKLTSGATLRVGFLENATYPDGTPVALVAAVQEFGSPSQGIPPRPFFRATIMTKSEGWGTAVANALMTNDFDAEKALALTGLGIKGQLQQSIAEWDGPPLSEKTVKAKGFAKPLVWTGTMLNSVDFEVESGSK